MLFSVFTPTHNPKYLGRLAASLDIQTLKDFEWVVVPNNGARIGSDVIIPQLQIVPFYGDSKNVGALKAYACKAAKGDILVEVDHDDELTPDCLEKLAATFADETVMFAYSNNVELCTDGTCMRFGPAYGWEYRPFTYQGKQLEQLVAFPPMPASLSRIWYAPNHVRAWRRSFYEKIGGHDETMDVLDDQDLIDRTYIAGGKMVHVDECLYIYHRHEENTCFSAEKNQRIQDLTVELHDKYIYHIVERWCADNNLPKVDLCCGDNCPAGYTGVDLLHGPIKADLNERWPFEDGSVGMFRAHDAIEHLRDPIHTMKEAYRCLAPNGWFLTFTPSTDGRGAFCDPTHVSFWNSVSMRYYTEDAFARFIGTPVKFQAVRLKDFFPTPWHVTHNIPYVKCDLLKFAGRTPGLIEIGRTSPIGDTAPLQ